MHAVHFLSSVATRPNLELKTQPKQLLDITLPDLIYWKKLKTYAMEKWHRISLTYQKVKAI